MLFRDVVVVTWDVRTVVLSFDVRTRSAFDFVVEIFATFIVVVFVLDFFGAAFVVATTVFFFGFTFSSSSDDP